MRTEELIVQLACTAGPVQPLAGPARRLARWTVATVPPIALVALVIGPRADVLIAMQQPMFAGLAAATLGTALVSAAGALLLGVPGAERSSLQRIAPFVAAGIWALVLVASLRNGGQALQRVLVLPFHWACLIEIVGFSIGPGWALIAMLRRAAPLRRARSAALAALAAGALGAFATQFICPLDDAAHQLVGHLLPVAFLSVCGASVGYRWLSWLGPKEAS